MLQIREIGVATVKDVPKELHGAKVLTLYIVPF